VGEKKEREEISSIVRPKKRGIALLAPITGGEEKYSEECPGKKKGGYATALDPGEGDFGNLRKRKMRG